MLEGVALLIGVNNYTGDGFERLPTAGHETTIILNGLLGLGVPMSNIILRNDQHVGGPKTDLPDERKAEDYNLKAAVKKFQKLLKDRSGRCWAFFSFAGHGLQQEGRELYLLGSDASARKFNPAFDGIRLEEHVLESMRKHSVASLVVLNYCCGASSRGPTEQPRLQESQSAPLPVQQQRQPPASGGVFMWQATRPQATVSINNFTVKLAKYLFDRELKVAKADEEARREMYAVGQQIKSARVGTGNPVPLTTALNMPLAEWSRLLEGSTLATVAAARPSSSPMAKALWKLVQVSIPELASWTHKVGRLEGLQWSTRGGEMETPAAGLLGERQRHSRSDTRSCVPQYSTDASLAMTERAKSEGTAALTAAERSKSEGTAALTAAERKKPVGTAALMVVERKKPEAAAAAPAADREKQEEEEEEEEEAPAAAAERQKQTPEAAIASGKVGWLAPLRFPAPLLVLLVLLWFAVPTEALYRWGQPCLLLRTSSVASFRHPSARSSIRIGNNALPDSVRFVAHPTDVDAIPADLHDLPSSMFDCLNIMAAEPGLDGSMALGYALGSHTFTWGGTLACTAMTARRTSKKGMKVASRVTIHVSSTYAASQGGSVAGT